MTSTTQKVAVSKKNYVWLRIIDPSVSAINVSSKMLRLAIDMIEIVIEFHSIQPITALDKKLYRLIVYFPMKTYVHGLCLKPHTKVNPMRSHNMYL